MRKTAFLLLVCAAVLTSTRPTSHVVAEASTVAVPVSRGAVETNVVPEEAAPSFNAGVLPVIDGDIPAVVSDGGASGN
ncbi:hypothetical protein CLCR_02194 [Cladophialophora carrionii]|uniref:Secreted protein n=1 Tax=Cladophialophora carrionii TaxID=86049 RepID=A0A1C1CDV6_9EURO|nr:hypothetical protein CLCR_02194 [Cladophialophora carrionii]